MTYLQTAHARLLHAIAKAVPPTFSMFPTADQFEAHKDHTAEVTAAFGEYLACIGREASDNATETKIDAKDFSEAIQSAIDDRSLLSALQDEADALREGETHRSDREEHCTYVGAP